MVVWGTRHLRARMCLAVVLAGLMVLTGVSPVAAADGLTGIAGQVVREDGSAVAGATVTMTPDRDGAPATTTTDPSGRYVLDTDSGGHVLRVAPPGDAPDLAPRELPVAIEAGHRSTRDVVLRSANLTGVVRAPDGEPVAGARVTVWQYHYSSTPMVSESGADGAFAMTVGEGHLSVWAEPPPTLAPHTHAGSVQQYKEVPAGGVLAGVELLLRPVAVTGRVLSPDSGTPVVGARVDVQGGGGSDSAETGADGTFAAALPATGTVNIVARPPIANPDGWGQVKRAVQYEGPAPADAGDLVLDGAHNVSGRVLGPSGEGVAAAELTLSGWDAAGAFVHVTTQTDVRGAYRVVAPRSGSSGYTVRAAAAGGSNELLPASRSSVVVQADPVVVPDLALKAPDLRGLAREPVTGDPLRSIRVRVRNASGDAVAESTSDGTALYGVDLPAGDYQVVADVPKREAGRWIRKMSSATVVDGTATNADVGFRMAPPAPYALAGDALPLPKISGLESIGYTSLPPALSPNGRYAVYQGMYQEEGAPPPNCSGEVCSSAPKTRPLFRVEVATGKTVRVDVSSSGTPTDNVRAAAVSSSGEVAFVSDTDGLTVGEADDAADVFLRDPEQETTVLLSDEPVHHREGQSYESDVDAQVSISADGARVAWTEPSWAMGPNDDDIETGEVVVADAATASRREFPEGLASFPVLSADGSTLAYTSHMGSWEWDRYPPGHVDGDDEHRTQVEVVDLTEADNDSDALFDVYDGGDSPWMDSNDELPDYTAPSLTDDGRTVAYGSYADDCATCGGYQHAANVAEWRSPAGARQVAAFGDEYMAPYGPERVVISGDGRWLGLLAHVNDYDQAAESSRQLWRHDLTGDGTGSRVALVSQDENGTLGADGRSISLRVSSRPFTSDGSVVVFGATGTGAPRAYVGRIPETDAPTWHAATLTASDVGTASLRLSWTAAADAVGVAGYRVFRDGTVIADVPSGQLSTTVSGLTPATTYEFSVEAYDHAGNQSATGPRATVRTLDATTRELLPLSASVSGSAVALAWDAAPATAETVVVRRAVNGGPQADEATLARDATAYRDTTAPAGATVDYQVWTTDSSGTATPYTKIATVTTPQLVLSAVDWTAPRVGTSVLRLHSDLAITLRGSPGRSASATVAYSSWYDGATLLTAPVAARATVLLAEDKATPGVYRGTFPLAEGVAAITGITGALSDDGSTTLTKQAGRLPATVSGAVRTTASGADPLDGMLLALVSASTGFGAQHRLTGGDAVTFSAVPVARDYVVEARGDKNWLAGRAVDLEVLAGRTTAVTLPVTHPGSVAVTISVPDGGAPPAFGVQVLHADTGSLLLTGRTWNGRATLGPLRADTPVRVRVVPPSHSDYVTQTRDLVLTRGENAVALAAAPPQKGAVTGVVRAAGRPVQGAQVTLVHYVEGSSRTAHTSTGDDGSYTVEGFHGAASLSVSHAGVTAPTADVAIPAGGTVTHDVVIPRPSPREVLVQLRTRRSVDAEWSPVTVDWRTAVHFGQMRPMVGGHGRAHTWHFDESTGRNLLLIDGRDGEVVRLCANAHEVGLGSACAEATLTASDDAALRLDIGPAPVVRGRIVDQGGRPVRGHVTLSRVEGDIPVLVRRDWAGDSGFAVETPGGSGMHVLTMTSAEGRAGRTFTLADGDVDLGELVLRPTTTFTSDRNALRALDPVARPGQLLTLDATFSNDSAKALDAVTARLDLPSGVALEPESVLVDGRAPEGSTGSSSVALGGFAAGQLRRLRFSVQVPLGYPSGSVPVAVAAVVGSAVEDHLPEVAVPVERVTIHPIPVLGSSTFPVGGSAPSGSLVTVRDGATVIGTAVAGAGGRWRSRVTVASDGFPSRHVLTATVGSGADVLVAEEVAFVDHTRPVPLSATVAQGGGSDRRSHTFDPRDGAGEFVFTWVPNQPLELKASFGSGSRVSAATFYVGDQRIPAAVAAGGTVSASKVIGTPGDIYVETEVGAPPSVTMPPRPASLTSTAAGRLPSAFSGYGATVQRETEQEVDLEFALPAAGGAKVQATVRARQISNYQPTAEDAARVNRTGRHVYGASITNTGDSVSLRVILPESEVERLGGSLPDSGGGSGSLRRSGTFEGAYGNSSLPLAPKGVELAFTLSTGGWDAFSAAGAGGKYGELNKLLDQLDAMNCNDEFNAKWRAEIDALANWMIAADAGAAVLTVAGAVAGAFTAGAGALAVWAAGLVIGLMVDDVIADEVEDMKRRMAQESSECLRPKRKQIARPTWIIDPSGYVFEGLRTRRVGGVTATLLQASAENGPWELAEMEQYGQQNPVLSDGQGRYGWNVPQGWWKVQYTKDGYETAFSRPLKVLPPHLDVDQSMVRLEAPSVTSVHATPQRSFRVAFSHLMRVTSVGPGIVLRNPAGESVPVTVAPVDPADDDAGVALADTFLVVPTEAQPDGSYSLEVPAELQNYAGRLMASRNVSSVSLPGSADTGTTPSSSATPTPAASGSNPSAPEPGQVGSASPSATPASNASSPSSSPLPSAAAPSPTAGASCAAPPILELELSTIVATGASGLTVTGAPGAAIDVFAYTRPSTTYRVVRSGILDAGGHASFRVVPPANTRLYARQRGCEPGPSVVLNVRTALTLTAVRTGARTYRFAGDSLPARQGGLIVSLYRVTRDGRQVLTAQARARASDGEWSVTRRFLSGGHFGFVARTGQDLRNAPGASGVRPTVVF